jgi:dinuclear metal center YbgI/SA1388 family protein
MKVHDFIDKFERYFPISLASEWDNIGLQIGNENQIISNILLSLDLTDEVISEAIESQSNLIVVHHPVIFKPLKQLVTSNYQSKLIHRLIKEDICVYVAHTNFDVSNYGMNTILAEKLQLNNHSVLLFETDQEGLGRKGELANEMTIAEYAKFVKKVFNIDTMRLITTSDLNHIVSTAAVVGGSGSHIIHTGLLDEVDVYITGDIKYHDALDAINKGYTIFDVGHNIEKEALPKLKELLQEIVKNHEIIISSVNTNPFQKI